MGDITENKDKIAEKAMERVRDAEERCLAHQERTMSLIRPDLSKALDDLRRLADEVEGRIDRMVKGEEERAEFAGKPMETERVPAKTNATPSEGDKPAAAK